MRWIFILILIVLLIVAGLVVLDYFGYYINWEKSILSLAILIPIVKAIQSFLTNPVDEFNKVKDKINKD